jgi:3-hydroxymyristoyl/3-hydroxydecanoyl-(acyl carrier protein) dehydratase
MADLLKYGDEFRFVDETLQVDIRAGLITTSKVYRSDWDIVVAHTLATGPVVPGVLLIEQAAQSALLLCSYREPDAVARPRLANIRATWNAPGTLDTPIHAHVQVRVATASTSSFEASIRCNGLDIARIRGLVAFIGSGESES